MIIAELGILMMKITTVAVMVMAVFQAIGIASE